jgi:hypothetical protein
MSSIPISMDQTTISPLALKLDETRDAHEKAVFAVMIAWHIDSCYKDILGLFKRATATVPWGQDKRPPECKSDEADR